MQARPLTAWRVIALLLRCHGSVASVSRRAGAAIASLAGLSLPDPDSAADGEAGGSREKGVHTPSGHASHGGRSKRHGGVPPRTDGDEEGGEVSEGGGVDIAAALHPFAVEAALLICECDHAAPLVVAEATCTFVAAAVTAAPVLSSLFRAQQPDAVAALQALLLAQGPQLARKLPASVLRTVARVCELTSDHAAGASAHAAPVAGSGTGGRGGVHRGSKKH